MLSRPTTNPLLALGAQLARRARGAGKDPMGRREDAAIAWVNVRAAVGRRARWRNRRPVQKRTARQARHLQKRQHPRRRIGSTTRVSPSPSDGPPAPPRAQLPHARVGTRTRFEERSWHSRALDCTSEPSRASVTAVATTRVARSDIPPAGVVTSRDVPEPGVARRPGTGAASSETRPSKANRAEPDGARFSPAPWPALPGRRVVSAGNHEGHSSGGGR